MAARAPRPVWFIVGTEACERFSYYGIISLLTLYLTDQVRLSADHAKELVHVFKMAVYFLPLAGAYLADRWLGRYWTILSLSLFYCAGHATLALFGGSLGGIGAGLGLIALGAGGIKPCVSAFVGDQFTDADRAQLPKVYGLFYWAINLGAMFAFALVPLIRDHAGYRWAFGVPGLFMGLAALLFRAGSSWYVKLPPSARRPPVAVQPADQPALAEGAASRVRVFWRIVLVLLPVPVFWALYDQINTSWVLQGRRMESFELAACTLGLLDYKVDAERIQSASALLVLLWVPVLTMGVYPWAERRGVKITPLRRMGAGMIFAAVAFVVCAWLEERLEDGQRLSLAWQIVPYVFLELGEVLLSATGLEFAYTQAPPGQKSLVMSVWLLTVSVGNFLVAAITSLNSQFVRARGATEFLFYAALMLVVAGVFAVLARGYRSASAD